MDLDCRPSDVLAAHAAACSHLSGPNPLAADCFTLESFPPLSKTHPPSYPVDLFSDHDHAGSNRIAFPDADGLLYPTRFGLQNELHNNFLATPPIDTIGLVDVDLASGNYSPMTQHHFTAPSAEENSLVEGSFLPLSGDFLPSTTAVNPPETLGYATESLSVQLNPDLYELSLYIASEESNQPAPEIALPSPLFQQPVPSQSGNNYAYPDHTVTMTSSPYEYAPYSAHSYTPSHSHSPSNQHNMAYTGTRETSTSPRASRTTRTPTRSRAQPYLTAPAALPLPSSSSSSSPPFDPLFPPTTLVTSARRNAPAVKSPSSSDPTSSSTSSSGTSANRWKCPYCSYVQAKHRTPDLARHIETHNPPTARWVCCGLPLGSALELIGADVGSLDVFEFAGQLMAGGCRRTFSRRDALARHLRREVGRCWGDAMSPLQPGNQEKQKQGSRR